MLSLPEMGFGVFVGRSKHAPNQARVTAPGSAQAFAFRKDGDADHGAPIVRQCCRCQGAQAPS